MEVFKSVFPLLDVGNGVGDKGDIFFDGSRIPLSSQFFSDLQVSMLKVVFVDSGSGSILSAGTSCVDFIRLYYGVYEEVDCIKRSLSEYVLAVVAKGDGGIFYDCSLFDLSGALVKSWRIDAFDPVLCVGKRMALPLAVSGYIRSVLEFEKVLECAGEYPGCVVVRDGDLDCRGGLLSSIKDSISDVSAKNKVCVLGLSKTSSLCTSSGASAIVAVGSIAGKGPWLYDAGSSVCFVKLHPVSRYIFRCDVLGRLFLRDALGALVLQSSDPVFLGYPYGLLDADKFAQVPLAELDGLRIRFEVMSRGVFTGLKSTLDAHSILDKL